MVENENLLTPTERNVLETLVQQEGIDAQRARALLAVDDGESQADAAGLAGLTPGQVNYALRKFRSQRLLAFPGATAYVTATEEAGRVAEGEAEVPGEAPVSAGRAATEKPQAASSARRLDQLLAELDKLVVDLRTALPDDGQSPYSPLQMLKLVRANLSRFTPDVQVQILEMFEGMTAEDLRDLDTWKGIAYMIAYSAQFQAAQTRNRLNQQMPTPLKPDTILGMMKRGLDRVTPEVAKNIAGQLEGASREDLMDPDTWKGMVYLIGYSAQFQASQTKDKLNEQLPQPIKPDTLLKLLRDGLDRVTPDVAKQIVASFEGATKEDLLDPDTWKGVWYMLNYSLQFQAEQLKMRLRGEGSETAEETA